MSKIALFAVSLTALALAGCSGSTDDPTSLAVCGINCQPDDGGGSGGGSGGGGGGGSGGGGNNGGNNGGGSGDGGGNNVGLSTGDTTIALESGVLVSPVTGSLSRLTINDQPSTGRIEIDTKSSTNGNWPTSKVMKEYVPGSNAANYFGSPNNLGATGYKEYRVISATDNTDEVLQVWSFGDEAAGNDSYITQFRTAGGGFQAVSFGGTKTALADMPTSATATYVGAYGSTAEASNWIAPEANDPDTVVINPNNTFMSNGTAVIQADFGAQTVEGTLTPEHWKYFDVGWNYYDVASNELTQPDGTITDNVIAPGYFETAIKLNGTITGNTYSGTAEMDGNFVSGDNPMYGAFFGAGANQTTGIFAVRGVSPDPIGGEFPINDDRRGYVQHTGGFNATCQAGGACAP